MRNIIPQINGFEQLSWQKELAQAFTEPEALLKYLGLDPNKHQKDLEARRLFPMRVPRHFAALMQKKDVNDPLFRQVFPLAEEFIESEDYVDDPLGEISANVHWNGETLPGVLHKYRSRVLLILKPGCAVNCRYCFRRHFPYQQHSPNKLLWQKSFNYIKENPQINEVIFSGGDPLMASNKELKWFCDHLIKIPHVKRIRIHTRLPVVLPQRMDNELLQYLAELPLPIVFVFHINHANEVSEELKIVCKKMRDLGITLLNQSVLLNDINNDVKVLTQLSEALFDIGILPYYLHVLDKTTGTTHFDIAEEESKKIMAGLRRELPGFLVPKLVREIEGEASKTPIG